MPSKPLAPLILFDVTAFVNVDECVKGTKIVPVETELKSIRENSESEQDKTNEKLSKETQTERHYNELQVLAMICDRFYFIILFVFTAFTILYGQTTLYAR